MAEVRSYQRLYVGRLCVADRGQRCRNGSSDDHWSADGELGQSD